MNNFSVHDGAWAQRVRKEVWNNDTLRNFVTEVGQETIRSKYGLGQVEG